MKSTVVKISDEMKIPEETVMKNLCKKTKY